MKAAAAAFLLAAGLVSGTVSAQDAPSEVTDDEIARYKAKATSACREAGMKRGDAQVKVDAFCTCMIDTLSKSMKRPEWQQAYFYSNKNLEKEEEAVLAPHLGRLEACRPKQ